MATSTPAVRVEPITTPDDFPRFFDIMAATLGQQTSDGIFCAFNPGWDNPEGREVAISRLISRWLSITTDRNGDLNTFFLKATVPRSDGNEEKIAGVSIWVQMSSVQGYGEKPSTGLKQELLDKLYPDNPTEHRYLRQIDASLHRRRLEVLREIENSDSPAAFVMDLCVVDPAFQRRGIASKLVEWGLEEAKRRGGLEAVTEASSMGRHVYQKLGFVPEDGDLEAWVDEEFRGRSWPSNVFMRTGRPRKSS
jgi:GNAT superfamily N-acetyltransferase